MNCEISSCHIVVAEEAVLLGHDAVLSDDLFLTCCHLYGQIYQEWFTSKMEAIIALKMQ
jgi:hypothetical protein